VELNADQQEFADELIRADIRLWPIMFYRHVTGCSLNEALGAVDDRQRQLGVSFNGDSFARKDAFEGLNAVKDPVVVIEASWDGDSGGWFIRLTAIAQVPSEYHPRFTAHGLCLVRRWGKMVERAEELGRELAELAGAPFYLTSVEVDDRVRWWDTQPAEEETIMPNEQDALNYYGDQENARHYDSQTGFDPGRKQEMLRVTLRLLMDMAPAGARLLELGAGSGLFTRMLADSRHFSIIQATDGAKAMLDLARPRLDATQAPVVFYALDFTQEDWGGACRGASFEAVTSSMALHHATNKRRLFRQVFDALAPGGAFVFANHMAGSSPLTSRLIGLERGRVKIREERPALTDLEAFIQADERKQEQQGNRCEAVADYLGHLGAVGFTDVDCLWRSYWLAVFVARKSRGETEFGA